MLSFWINVLEQGLIFGIMALGVFITYKILDFPDLSVDGSFPLGASVAAIAISSGINPIAASLLSIVFGMISGLFTGILHVKCKITNLLSGILVMTALYSVNLRIMGKANLPLLNETTIFSSNLSPIIVISIIVFICKILLDLFLKTRIGFLLRSTGDNPQLITSLGVDIGKIKILGLMIANGLVALSGAVMAQYQRFSDVGMGIGIVVAGLAAIIFGETVFKKLKFASPTTLAIAGSILYKLATGIALKFNIPPSDLKLITAIIVVIALTLSGSSVVKKRSSKTLKGGKVNVKTMELEQSI